MTFNLGKPILAMLALTALSSVAILFRPAKPDADLTIWVFADSHAKTYRSILPEFERAVGKTVRLDLIGNRALGTRLFSAFMSQTVGKEVPDLVEIEISSVGRYFRPPVEDIGFMPLNDLLETRGARKIASLEAPGEEGWNAELDGKIFTFRDGEWVLNPERSQPDMWIDRIVKSRFAPWTKEGKIFGVPHDVHPMTISYRADLFEEAGVDLAAARTWPEFQEMSLAYQRYWKEQGRPHRHAMEMQESSADHLVSMLLQRGINVIDDYGQMHLTNPKVAETVAFYAQLVAGPRAIAVESPGGMGVFTQDMEQGNIGAIFTPDWRVRYVREFTPQIAGKMRMMELPIFDPGDHPTGTWGGTMIAIPKTSPNRELAWQLIEFLYLSDTGLQARLEETNILPPVIEHWQSPEYHAADPYFGGQRVGELYIRLAPQVPRRFVTPMTTLAQQQLSVVLTQAVQHVRRHGVDGLEARCSEWLAESARDLAARIEHQKFEK